MDLVESSAPLGHANQLQRRDSSYLTKEENRLSKQQMREQISHSRWFSEKYYNEEQRATDSEQSGIGQKVLLRRNMKEESLKWDVGTHVWGLWLVKAK